MRTHRFRGQEVVYEEGLSHPDPARMVWIGPQLHEKLSVARGAVWINTTNNRLYVNLGSEYRTLWFALRGPSLARAKLWVRHQLRTLWKMLKR